MGGGSDSVECSLVGEFLLGLLKGSVFPRANLQSKSGGIWAGNPFVNQ